MSVRVTQSADAGQSTINETVYFVGRSDGLLHRIKRETHMKSPRGSMDLTSDAVAQNIVVNAPLPAARTVFTYAPPQGVTREKPEPAPVPLLANGTIAPDFAAIDKDGNTIKLSDYRGKVVLLDFWASWCPPCVASMPHNQALTKKLQGENLPMVLLAIDDSEEQAAFLKWVNAHRELGAITFAYVDPKTTRLPVESYRVTGIPPQYVIDAQGIIRASGVGYDDHSDALEQAVRAAAQQK